MEGTCGGGPSYKSMGKEMGKVAVSAACQRCFAGWNLLIYLAPQVGLEPTTLRLTAECSTIELLRIRAGN
jgi:hypothetical protein